MFIRGDKVLESRNCTSADIRRAFGQSHVIPRKSTDSHYESELLLKTLMLLDTNDRKRACRTEHHVFRLQNGEWSFWDADEKGNVRRKIQDLKYYDEDAGFNYETLFPSFRATDQKWEERYGKNVYLGFKFYLGGNEPTLTVTHRIQFENGRDTVEVTTYSKVGEFEQAGWSEWLIEKLKAGYQRLQAYGTEAKD